METLNNGETGLSIRTKINSNFVELLNRSGLIAGSFSTALPTVAIVTDKLYVYAGNDNTTIGGIVWRNGDSALYNGSTWSRIPFQSLTNYYTKNEIESITGLESLVSYPILFSAFGSVGGNNNIYINDLAVSTRGRVKTLRVKAPIGTIITPYAYQIQGTEGSYTFTLLHTYSNILTSTLEQSIAITDDYIIEAGMYVGVKSTSGFYYTGSGKSYQVGQASSNGLTLGFDFVINKNTSIGINDNINLINASITSLNSATKSEPCILYKNKFNSLTDFINQSTAWTATSGNATPTALGSETLNYLWLRKRYHADELILTLKVKLYSDTIFAIQAQGIDYSQGSGFYKINVAANKISIHSSDGTELQNSTISITSGRTYIVLLQRNGWITTFTLIDSLTGLSVTNTYGTALTYLDSEPMMRDSFKFFQQAGSTFASISDLIISSKSKPLIWLGGDSIAAGNYFSTSTFAYRYSVLLKTYFGGNVIVSAQGGSRLENDIVETVETEVAIMKPVYTMLSIGTNNGISVAALTTCVNRIITLGSIPIINHVPNRADGSHILTNQRIDEVCQATDAISGAKFDIATSIDNNPANSYIVNYYEDAGVHPNVAGNTAMFNRMKIDLPFLFN